MSTTTNETNGATATEQGPAGASGVRNRVRGLTPVSKFQRLYALAGKAERKTFTARRETEEGVFALRLDGFPETLDAEGVAKLAQNGAKVAGSVIVGAATGRFSGVVIGAT